MSPRRHPGAILLQAEAPHWYWASRLLTQPERRIVENLATIFILIRKTVTNCGSTNEAVATIQKMALVFREPDNLEAQYSIIQDFPNFELAVRAWKEIALFLDVSIPPEYFIENLMGIETRVRRIRPQSEADLLLDLYREFGTIALAIAHGLNTDERALPAIADLATGLALCDAFNSGTQREFLAPIVWSGREKSERQRLSAIFLASARLGLSALPLRMRLILFLPVRYDFRGLHQSKFRTLDFSIDELFTQLFASLNKRSKATRYEKKPSFIDSKLIVRNQLTRIGLFPSTKAVNLKNPQQLPKNQEQEIE